MLEETDLSDFEVDARPFLEDNSKAAGGLGKPTLPPKLCKEHKYDRISCLACAEEKNHNEKGSSRWRPTKSTPAKGALYRQAWYDRQAKTLARLRGEEYGE